MQWKESPVLQANAFVHVFGMGILVVLVAAFLSTNILNQNGAPAAAVVGPVLVDRLGDEGFALYKGVPTPTLYKTKFPSGGTTSFTASVPANNVGNGTPNHPFWLNPTQNELYYPTLKPQGAGVDIEVFDSTTLQSKGILPTFPTVESMAGAVSPNGLFLGISANSFSTNTEKLYVYFLLNPTILFSQPLGSMEYVRSIAFSADSSVVGVLESSNDTVFRAFDVTSGSLLASIPNQSFETVGLVSTQNGFWYTEDGNVGGSNPLLHFVKVKPTVSVTNFSIPPGTTSTIASSPDFKWVGVGKGVNVIVANETGVKCTVPFGSIINRVQFGKSNTLYVSVFDPSGVEFHSINPTTCATQFIFDPPGAPGGSTTAPLGFVTPDETYLTWTKGNEFRWYNIPTGKTKLITMPVNPPTGVLVSGEDT